MFALLVVVFVFIPHLILADSAKEYRQEELGYINGIYAIQATVGSPEQHVLFLVDTLRSSSSIISTSCSVCLIQGFDNTSSTTFVLESQSNATVVMNNEDFIGYFSHDTINFPHFNINNYQFLLVDIITHTTQFKYEGFIGLGFSKRRETYLSYLKNAKVINHKVFGMHLKATTENGDLHVGGIDSSLENFTENVSYAGVSFTDENDTFTDWYIYSDKLNVNKSSKNISIQGPHRVVLNSALSIIKIPKAFFFSNMQNLFPKEGRCQISQDSLFHCLCENNYQKIYPTLSFHFTDSVTLQDKEIKITPKDYVSFTSSITSTPDSNCLVLFSLNYKNDYWELGTTVMNNFYLIFDQEKDRVGFYRYKEEHYRSNELLISLLSISGSLVFVITIYLSYKYCCLNCNRRNGQRNNSFAVVDNNDS